MEAIIPVVDFQKLSEEEEEWKKLREACEKYGYFRIINHPIPLTLMAEMKLVVKHLHGLPKEIKMRNKSNSPNFGYVSTVKISPLYEGLGIYDMHESPDALQDFFSQLNVSPHHRKIIEEYGKAIHELASGISEKMAESLGIVGIDFKDWRFAFKTIKYDFTEESIGSLGTQLHSDTGFITLLQDDENVGGLELMDESSSILKAAPPKPGSFFFLVGDVGRVWSNGRFKNVEHHVLCREGSTRYTFGLFMFTSRDGNVEAPAKLVELDNARFCHPFKYEDLREHRITKRATFDEFFESFPH